ncbi:thermonuclease family protein (plasmid) [Agrobacterium tumefaciens]|uniref:Thermonuclease family protein n=2 Tax=Agrobacterium tumefaciens TaxID=358 RepID=A0AAJ4N8Z6_AGRTU|nr:thermonuclease family protein [Agrobacterium tumefaciens]
MLLMWVMALTVGGGIYLERTGGLDQMVALASVPANDSLSGSFSICGDSRRVNCVVDGDTFWIQGEKIRVADIDTPELSPPRCAAERIKGEAAKARLRVLLSAGPFSMSAGLRDEDKYGRKLRTVTRNGQSLGEILVGEGLARRWDGARRGWCDS